VTSIDFYFNAGDKLQVACRLAGKAMEHRKRLLIYAPQSNIAQSIDRMLWTWPAIGFVPHCHAGDALVAETPVLIASDTETPDGCELLLNLAADSPPHFARFDRLLEIVSTDAQDRDAGRARYKFYRDRGYAIESHDLATQGNRT